MHIATFGELPGGQTGKSSAQDPIDMVMVLLSIALSLGAALLLPLSDQAFDWHLWAASSAFCVIASAVAGSALRHALAQSRERDLDFGSDYGLPGTIPLDGTLVSAGHALIDNDADIERVSAQVKAGLQSLAAVEGTLCSKVIGLTRRIQENVRMLIELGSSAPGVTQEINALADHVAASDGVLEELSRAVVQIGCVISDDADVGVELSVDHLHGANRSRDHSLNAKIATLEMKLSPAINSASELPVRLRSIVALIEGMSQKNSEIAANMETQSVMFAEISRLVQVLPALTDSLMQYNDRISAMQTACRNSAKVFQREVERNPAHTATIARLLVGIGRASSKRHSSTGSLRKFLGSS